MIIQSSHLALRFYKYQGWTRDMITPYVTSGEVLDQVEGQEVRDYYFIRPKSKLDVRRLYRDLRPTVVTYDGESILDEEAIVYMEQISNY